MALSLANEHDEWAKRYKELVESGSAVPPRDKPSVSRGIPSTTAVLSREWGISMDAARKRLWAARQENPAPFDAVDAAYFAKRKADNIKGASVGTPAPWTGFEVASVSQRMNRNGDFDGETVHMRQERGEKFEVPKGHRVKGVSAYTDADGRIIGQWLKTTEGELTTEAICEAVEAAFKGFKPAAKAVKPKAGDSDRMAVYPLADWHVGLFAWGKETDGPDWDLSIARKVLAETMQEVFDATPKADRAIVLGLGDLMHVDDNKNKTPGHGNPLDADSRYAKMLDTATELVIEAIEMARRKHSSVEVVLKQGNHDPISTVAMRQAIRLYYRNTDGVTVDASPSPFYATRFGVNLVAATHGDGPKPDELPMIMAQLWPSDWAASTTRHFHCGHRHHDRLIEKSGVCVYQHRAPVPKDAWHAQQGYMSGRSMRSFSYHHDLGLRSMTEVEIK